MSRCFLCVQPTTCSLSKSMIWHWPSPSDCCFRFSLICEPQFSQILSVNASCLFAERVVVSFSAPLVEELVDAVHDGVYPPDHCCTSRGLHRLFLPGVSG